MNLGSVGPELTLTTMLFQASSHLTVTLFIMVILLSPFCRLENQGSGKLKNQSEINALAILWAINPQVTLLHNAPVFCLLISLQPPFFSLIACGFDTFSELVVEFTFLDGLNQFFCGENMSIYLGQYLYMLQC